MPMTGFKVHSHSTVSDWSIYKFSYFLSCIVFQSLSSMADENWVVGIFKLLNLLYMWGSPEKMMKIWFWPKLIQLYSMLWHVSFLTVWSGFWKVTHHGKMESVQLVIRYLLSKCLWCSCTFTSKSKQRNVSLHSIRTTMDNKVLKCSKRTNKRR